MSRDSDFRSPLKPLETNSPSSREPVPAPPVIALLSAWVGLIMLIASIVFVFLPGTRNPRAELEGRTRYSVADRFLPIPIYGVTIAMTLGILVLWPMRKMPRPLPEPMVMQRVQAWIGVVLALIGAVILYVDVALRMPK